MASVYGAGSVKPRSTQRSTSKGKKDSRSPCAQSESRDRRSPTRLAELIEQDIIPRLLVAHGARAAPATASRRIDAEEIERFAPLPLTLEADELLGLVEAYLVEGVPAETIFVDLLARSARRLGEYWEEDRADFVEVTMGLWRLQEVMREIARRSPPIAGALTAQRAALFAPMPGEQHSFGTTMVEECFARAGWDTELMLDSEDDALLAKLADRSFDLVGLTMSCDCHIEPLPNLVRAMRSVSRNSDIRVMIGGRVTLEDPSVAIDAGADATARTATEAVRSADALVPLSAVRSPLTL